MNTKTCLKFACIEKIRHACQNSLLLHEIAGKHTGSSANYPQLHQLTKNELLA